MLTNALTICINHVFFSAIITMIVPHNLLEAATERRLQRNMTATLKKLKSCVRRAINIA